MEQDPVDSTRPVESQMGPGQTTIDRLIHPVAVVHRIAWAALARPYPYDVRVSLIDRDGSDGLNRLIIKDRLPCCTSVHRTPDTACGRSYIDHIRIVNEHVYRVDATTLP